ncbi:hypothetical protein [Halorubrum aethiopicum]|uniref:hypothetical protein n=1 Tax=Halorubrum aethiopicum TaxID=1758255 RepID=UPI000ADAF601|nr:hypothetical protein [Halorubrum aethiopicum]
MNYRVLLAALLVVTATLPVGAVAAQPTADTPDGVVYQTDDQAGDETETNETSSGESDGENPDFNDDQPAEYADDGTPGAAAGLRITPVDFGEEWMGVETTDSDAEYATTGPFAVFSLSAPAESARVPQSAADAQLLEGEQTLRVDFEDDAAPVDGESYYEIELFFADGSTKTIGLTASQTGVSVAASDYAKYQPLIEEMEEPATERGFEATPEGLIEYHSWQQDRVEIIESFLVERAEQLFGVIVLAVQNPLAWVLALMALALAAFKREQQHGWMLDRIENDAGETARKDKQLRSAFAEHVQASNEEYIGKMDEVNDQQAQYWRDSFDVYSVRQLAELAKRGPHDPSGETVTDGGETRPAIATIDPDEIQNSWLAKAFSTNRLADAQEALTCIRAACVRMEAKYGLGHEYTETRDAVETLLEQVREKEASY